MAWIFLNYRRSDSGGHARSLARDLESHFPGEVFVDTESIEDGDRWDNVILKHLNECRVLLAVIGPDWLTARDPDSGQRRIDIEDDWVRREIETALARNIPLIPVLVGGAERLADKHRLWKSLKPLTRLEPREIRPRDAARDIEALAESIRSRIGPQPGNATDPRPYLQSLRDTTAFIDIRGLQVGQQKAHRFPIQELYVPLTTPIPAGRDREQPGPDREPTPLQAAVRAHPRLLLIGQPGAGKSTFLRRIAFALCQTLLGEDPQAAAAFLGESESPSPCPLPILVSAPVLAAFIAERNGGKPDPHAPEWIVRYLEWAANEYHWQLPAIFFRQHLAAGALLMVDSLDEAPGDTARDNLVRLLEEAARVRGWKATRLLAATRPSAYGGATHIDGFASSAIADLDDKAIQVFTANWCRALYPESAAAAASHQGELAREIGSRPEIRDMAGNPVMLTALAVLHWNDKRLPDQRVELYDSVLRWLARSREEKRGGKSGRPSPDRCLELHRDLALAMHTGQKEKQVEISPWKAAEALKQAFGSSHAEAEQFLRDEEIDSGIVVARGTNLRFWHQTFQEYLAARALAGRDDDRLRFLFGADHRKLYQPDWRETVLLLAGVLRSQDKQRIDDFLGAMLDELNDESPLAARARCVGLVGRILEDLESSGYRLEHLAWLPHVLRMEEVFTPEAAREIDFQIRLDAAEALGRAGDPRLAQDNWVRVEGGTFWMGAQTDREPNRDPEAYDDEAPVHQVTVSPFQMGRYPVTVEEYGRFVAAGGPEPEDWQRQLRHPNRPVVSVSWHDATAYCRWAGCRLPTEAEWECAARAGREGVRYPWGPEPPDASRANYWENGPRQPTPVGLYPAGATPTGIQDLAGNLWEWVSDWWGAYDNTPARNPAGPGKGTSNVLRGGAWFFNDRYLRVSYRVNGLPDGRFVYIGFRCVREVKSL